MKHDNSQKLDRRGFLRSIAFLGGAALIAGCNGNEKSENRVSVPLRKEWRNFSFPLYAFDIAGVDAVGVAELLDDLKVEFPVLVQFKTGEEGAVAELVRLIGSDNLCLAAVLKPGDSLSGDFVPDIIMYDLRDSENVELSMLSETTIPAGFIIPQNEKLLEMLLERVPALDCIEIEVSSRLWNNDSGFAGMLSEAVSERGLSVFVAQSLPSYCNTRPELANLEVRYAASVPGVVSVILPVSQPGLSGVVDSLACFEPLTAEQREFLSDTAQNILENKAVPCTECGSCMPCPYGIDIPAVFAHYNKCVALGNVPVNPATSDYIQARRAYLLSMDVGIPRLRRADRCVTCGACVSHCPEHINIPAEMCSISRYTALLSEN